MGTPQENFGGSAACRVQLYLSNIKQVNLTAYAINWASYCKPTERYAASAPFNARLTQNELSVLPQHAFRIVPFLPSVPFSLMPTRN